MGKRRVADFPVEYLDIWRLAAAGKLSLEFPTQGKATNKRQDLYTFRRRLAEESPELAQPLFNIDLLVCVNPAELGARIIGYVPDWKRQVREQLAKADFAPPDPVALVATAAAAAEVETTEHMTDTLKDLGFTTSNK